MCVIPMLVTSKGVDTLDKFYFAYLSKASVVPFYVNHLGLLGVFLIQLLG